MYLSKVFKQKLSYGKWLIFFVMFSRNSIYLHYCKYIWLNALNERKVMVRWPYMVKYFSQKDIFFLSGFSFTDTDNSQDSRGRREGTIFCFTKKLFQALSRYLILTGIKFKKLDENGRRTMYIYNSKWAFGNKNSKTVSNDGEETWKVYLDETVASKLMTENWLGKIFGKLRFREFNEN